MAPTPSANPGTRRLRSSSGHRPSAPAWVRNGSSKSPATDSNGGREQVRYGVSAEDGAETIHVEYSTVLGRDGATVSEPTVDHDELVAATPASVTVTISFDGRTHTETIPVWVQHSTERLE